MGLGMSRVVVFLVLAALVLPESVAAAVLVRVDISTQTMKVSVDGEPRHVWPISTGRLGYLTPNGTYRAQRLVRSWYSRKYGGAMPYSVFFRGGYAIHGTTEVRRLGRPASHGCIRLHPANAAKLFGLVKAARTTRIVITGSRPTMLAHEMPTRRAKLPSRPRSLPWDGQGDFAPIWLD